MRFARLIEQTVSLVEVATTEPTPAIDLNGADKYSVQVTAVALASIAHFEASNNGVNWTEVDDTSLAEGESVIFEQENVDYRYARVTIENDDISDVSADCLFLVIGDAV